MRWMVEIPKASAARLEANRKFVIEAFGFNFDNFYRFPIPDGADLIHFDFDFEENNPEINANVLDAQVRYRTFVEYKNSIGSRVEHIPVEVKPYPKCTKCDEYATYDSPENMCDVHRAEWWAHGIATTPEEFEQIKQEALQICKEEENSGL